MLRQVEIHPVRDELGQVRAPEKLALLEALLTTDDIEAAAQKCVDWLGEYSRAKRILCCAAVKEATRLVGLAGYGLEGGAVTSTTIDISDETHPLGAALRETEPFRTASNGSNPETFIVPAMGRGAFLVVPLSELAPDKPEGTAGLLLVSPLDPKTIPDASWLAHVLGEKLARLHAQTQIAESEKRLQKQRSLLYGVINAVPDPILLTDAESRLIVANARAESLLVANEGESEGRQRAVSLNNMLFSAVLSRTAIEGVEPEKRELLLVDPSDGSDRLFEVISSQATYPGEATGIVSVLRNITDLRAATEQIEENYRKLRLAEAQVRAERDRLDLIIDSVADPILVTDPVGSIVHMNVPAERLFAANLEEHGDDAVKVVRANDALFSSFLSSLFIAESGTKRLRGELNLVDPLTGSQMPFEAISGMVLSEQGEVSAVVTILHDRTEALEKARLYEQLKEASSKLEERVREATAELVRQNELLQRHKIELEQASQLKSQFLANMSHEFRTPLNAILGFTGLILKGVYGDLAQQQVRAVSRIDANARHLLNIINDILDIAKIEAGRMPVHVGDFEVAPLIQELMQQVEPLTRPGLKVSSHVPKRLLEMRSDRQKVKQILLNLLTNAIKFTPEGSVRIDVVYDKKSDDLSISVADTGIGIAPENHDKIFEDFRQVDSSPSREYGGTGLGLSICRRLANTLEGTIKVESKLGSGSTFTLILPRRLRRK
jgi:signal transduction histidine kinase